MQPDDKGLVGIASEHVGPENASGRFQPVVTRRRGILGFMAAIATMPAQRLLAEPNSRAVSEVSLRLPPGIAGMAVTVVSQGKPNETLVLGKASLAFDVPVSDSTLFGIGSISKHITAVALLRLAEQGKLDLNKPLRSFIPDLANDWGAPTLIELLGHVGGLAPDFPGVELDRPFDLNTVREYSTRLPPIARPRHAWVYSNIGYVLLGHVIERVAGESYGDHVTRALFRPNGLVDSRVDDCEAVIPGKAEPVKWDGAVFRRVLQMSRDVSGVAAGGLLMSPRDVASWDRALAGNALLSAKSKSLMWSSGTLASGRSTGYGTGWWIREDRSGKPVHLHTGSIPGFRAFYLRKPTEGLSVMIMLAGETRMMGLGLAQAERLWPGTSAFDSPAIVDREPGLTQFLFDVLTFKRPSSEMPLAPELAGIEASVREDELHPLSHGEASAIISRRLVEDRITRSERLRTYRISLPSREILLIAGYTLDGRLFRLTT